MSAFAPIASALPPGADLPDGIADGPLLTLSGQTARNRVMSAFIAGSGRLAGGNVRTEFSQSRTTVWARILTLRSAGLWQIRANRLKDTMGKRSAKIYVTKLAAAQRQLCAAIRMFFAGEDELAVHTVASAAYRVLRDLKAKRGRDEAADNYLNSVFYSVRAYRRGTLPDYIANDPEMMQFVRDMADRLPITASSKFEDVTASVSPDVAGDFWQRRNSVSNFLKHADRDAKSHISLDDVDNLYLLFQAGGAYLDITKDNLGPEGFVLWVYVNAVKGMKDGMPKQFRKYASRLEELDPDEQLRFCSEWLHKMKNATSPDR